MPLMVTRPVIDRSASVTRVRWRSVVASRHWLRQAKTIIMSGMGGCSSCELCLGCPYSTRSSTALPHTHFGEGIAFTEVIEVILSQMKEASVTRFECPTCLAVRDIQPKGDSVKFPWHPRRTTNTPNHGLRWV